MKVNCIIIDDDPIALKYLGNFTLQTPFLNLLSSHQTVAEAVKILETEKVQLIFLDIVMPDINGMEFARMLETSHGDKAPKIVFITGFAHLAIEGYKVNAIDYLLKPPSYEDFFKAAYKAKMLLKKAQQQSKDKFIFLKVEHELLRVQLNDILYIEGFKDYVKVYIRSTDSYVKALTTMKNLEEKLPVSLFMRVHRSYIVSLNKIDAINNQVIKIGKIKIPITDYYKAQFREIYEQWL
jgi:two-component system response regulator LytT